MRNKLLLRLEEMNSDLNQMIDYVNKYSEQELNSPPNPDSWSVTQIMNHVLLAEKNSLAYCKKKLSFKPSLERAGILSGLKSMLVGFYLASPFKFKAPKGIGTEALPSKDTIPSILEKWNTVRKDMKVFIKEVPNEYLDKEVYKHPFGGRLSLYGMMAFFQAHFKNHKRQIERALSRK